MSAPTTPISAEWPVTIIDAKCPAAHESPLELLRYWDLLTILASRDLRVRYRQALVGIAWAVIRPAVTVGVFVVLFGLLGRPPVNSTSSYAATALVGLLTWQLFATALTDMSESLVRSRHVLTKVYFPRAIIPLAAMAVSLVDYAVALVPLFGILVWQGANLHWPVIFFPVWIAGVLALVTAGGLMLSALNARYRDVGHVVPFLLQTGFFSSPVVYETTAIIPEKYLFLFRLNPMAPLLDGLRWSLTGGPQPDWVSTGIAAATISLGLWISWKVFHKLDELIVDRI